MVEAAGFACSRAGGARQPPYNPCDGCEVDPGDLRGDGSCGARRSEAMRMQKAGRASAPCNGVYISQDAGIDMESGGGTRQRSTPSLYGSISLAIAPGASPAASISVRGDRGCQHEFECAARRALRHGNSTQRERSRVHDDLRPLPRFELAGFLRAAVFLRYGPAAVPGTSGQTDFCRRSAQPHAGKIKIGNSSVYRRLDGGNTWWI